MGLGTKWGWDIKIKNIPPWSYPDAAAGAAATSAAVSAVLHLLRNYRRAPTRPRISI